MGENNLKISSLEEFNILIILLFLRSSTKGHHNSSVYCKHIFLKISYKIEATRLGFNYWQYTVKHKVEPFK